jgi:hypothetical protein
MCLNRKLYALPLAQTNDRSFWKWYSFKNGSPAEIEIRSLARMSSEETFTVKWGKFARTIEYADLHEQILFTFDVAGPKSLVLEHHAAATPRSSRYGIAFQRTKEFLEATGAQVEIYGK